MFQSEPPRIDLDGTVQASRGTAPTGHGWQGGEFATSIRSFVSTLFAQRPWPGPRMDGRLGPSAYSSWSVLDLPL